MGSLTTETQRAQRYFFSCREIPANENHAVAFGEGRRKAYMTAEDQKPDGKRKVWGAGETNFEILPLAALEGRLALLRMTDGARMHSIAQSA
jgi:hypothetical protein